MRSVAAAFAIAALLAACAPQPRVEPAQPARALPAPQPAPTAERASVPPLAAVAPQLPAPPRAAPDLDAYKAQVAAEIWRRNAEVYADAVPEMLKSIVVLEITIDRFGNPVGISVYRSNGFRHLETRALESVVRAAPFAAPAPAVLEPLGAVTFLETFLFRADERFQLRSLVLPPLAAAPR